MTLEKKCNSCNENFLIKENSLTSQPNLQNEKAYCPNCKTELYTGNTNGWFTVQKNETSIKMNSLCEYPMP